MNEAEKAIYRAMQSDGELCETCVIIVHPFYANKWTSAQLTGKKKNEFNSYSRQLQKILTCDTISTIFAEEMESLENVPLNILGPGSKNRLLITENGEGKFLDVLNIPHRELKKREVYFCGGYLGRCLRDAAIQIRNKTNFQISPLRFIKEASIYNPFGDSLYAPKDERDIPRGIERFVSIDDVLALANASQDHPQTDNYQSQQCQLLHS